jgi:hypothetical protein
MLTKNALCAEAVALGALIQPDTRNSFLIVGNPEVMTRTDAAGVTSGLPVILP